jgi:two-component system nitrogen regulation response regulator GlnG
LLVVDDEPNVHCSIEKTLQSDALDVITAASGSQAIDLARLARPNVAILDVRLGEMTGLEVFDRTGILFAMYSRLPP